MKSASSDVVNHYKQFAAVVVELEVGEHKVPSWLKKVRSERISETWWSFGALACGLLFMALGTFLFGRAFSSSSQPCDPQTMSDCVVVTQSINLHLLYIGLALAGVGIWANIANQKKSKKTAVEDSVRRQKHLMRFNDELTAVFGSISYLLGDLQRSDFTNANDAGEKFYRNAAREGARLFSHDGVRVCIYSYEDSYAGSAEEEALPENEDDVPSLDKVSSDSKSQRSEFLKLRSYHGRADSPRQDFNHETAHGRAIIEVAKGPTAVAIPDYRQPPISIERSIHAQWQSCLLVPLRVAGRSQPEGILCIDTRDQIVFTAEDVSIAWTVASILMLGESLMEGEARDTSPETSILVKRLAELDELSHG